MATVATMAKVALPAMQKRNFADSLASASIVSGGTLGILIPPSTTLVIYGIITETNIGELFMAAVIPGVIAIALLMLAVFVSVQLDPDSGPRSDRHGCASTGISGRGRTACQTISVHVFGSWS